MNVSPDEFRAYATVGKLMYEKILPLNRKENRDELHAYDTMAYAFFHYGLDNVGSGPVDRATNGFMLDLSEWVGLKLDAPEMADKFGRDVKASYPEIFKV